MVLEQKHIDCITCKIKRPFSVGIFDESKLGAYEENEIQKENDDLFQWKSDFGIDDDDDIDETNQKPVRKIQPQDRLVEWLDMAEVRPPLRKHWNLYTTTNGKRQCRKR